MSADRAIYIRLGVQDADKAMSALNRVGLTGEASLQRVAKASAPASAALRGVDQASQAVQGSLAGMAGRLGPVGAGLAAIHPAALLAAAGVGAASAALLKGAKDAAAAEQQLRRVEGVLRATGNASGQTVAGIESLAQEMQRARLVTAGEVREAAAILATFKSVTGDTFGTAIRVAQDMGAVMGGTLTSNIAQLGRALEDPIQGVSALRERGISLNVVQMDMIRGFVESGEKARAQAVILEELKNQVGGAGTEESDTLVGAFNAATVAIGELLETAAGGQLDGLKDRIRAVAGAIDEVTFAAGGGSSDQRRGFLEDQLAAGEARLTGLYAELKQLREGGAFGAQIRQQEKELAAEEKAVEALRLQYAALRADRQGDENKAAAEAAAAAAARDAAAQEARAAALAKFTEVQQRSIELAGIETREREKLAAADKAEADLKKELAKVQAAASAEEIAAARARAVAEVEAKQALEDAGKAEDERRRRAEKAQQEAAKEAEKRRDAVAAIEGQIAGLVDERAQLEMTDRERAIHVELLRAEEIARKANIALTAEQEKRIREETGALYDRNAAKGKQAELDREVKRKADEAARQVERAVEHSTGRIVDFTADAFDRLLSGTSGSVREIANDLLAVMRRTFAQIAAEAVIRPSIEGVISSALSGGMPRVGAGGGASGGAGVGISDLFSIGNLLSGGGILGAGGQAMVGNAALSLGFGPGMANAAIDAVNFSPWGIVGSLGARLLGLGGGIGGTIGGIGGSLAGGAAGAAWLGPALGAAGGPVGAIIGAFLGTALGGLFGSQPSDYTASFQGMLNGRVRPTEDGANEETRAARDELQGIVMSAIGQLTQMTGGRLSDDLYIDSAIGSRDGSRFWLYRTMEDLFGQPASARPEAIASGTYGSPEEMVAGLLEAIVGTLEDVPDDLREKLARVSFDDLEQGFGDVDLITRFDKIFQAAEPVGQMETGIRSLYAAFEDASERAERLELDVASVGDQFQDALSRLFTGEAVAGPYATAWRQLNEAIEATNEEAERLGLTLDSSIVQAMQETRGRLRAELSGNLDAAINDARGNGFLNQAAGFVAQFSANVAELEAVGLPAAKATELLSLQLAGLFAGLSPDQAAALRAELDRLGVSLDATTAKAASDAAMLASLEGGVTRTRNAYLAALQQEAAALEDQERAWRGLAVAMRNARLSLLTDPQLSPLGPAAQYAEARAQFIATRDAALGGDEEAAGRLEDVSRRFLEISQSYHADQAAFRADFDLVQAAMRDTEDAARRIADRALELLAVQRDQLASMGVLIDETRSIAEALAEYQAAVLALANAQAGAGVGGGGAGGGGITYADTGYQRSADDLIHGVDRATRDAILLSLGQTTAGGGAVQARIASDPAFAADYRQALIDAGGLPGFAYGGISRGPQIAMVSEGPYSAEAHVPLPDGRSIPVTVSNGGAGGDAVARAVARSGAETVAAVGEVADAVAALAGVVARQAAELGNLTKEVQRLALRPLPAPATGKL